MKSNWENSSLCSKWILKFCYTLFGDIWVYIGIDSECDRRREQILNWYYFYQISVLIWVTGNGVNYLTMYLNYNRDPKLRQKCPTSIDLKWKMKP